MRRMNVIRSRRHEVFTERVNKVALSARVMTNELFAKMGLIAYGYKKHLLMDIKKIGRVFKRMKMASERFLRGLLAVSLCLHCNAQRKCNNKIFPFLEAVARISVGICSNNI